MVVERAGRNQQKASRVQTNLTLAISAVAAAVKWGWSDTWTMCGASDDSPTASGFFQAGQVN